LSSVALPETLKKIGDKAFEYVPHLKSIYIPESVIEIGEGVFGRSKHLIIHGKKGSCAIEYAKKHHFSYVEE